MWTPIRRYIRLLGRYLRSYWQQSVLLIGLLLCSRGLELLNPQILRDFIDTARTNGTVPALTRIALLFLGVALLAQLMAFAEAYIAENIGLAATNRLRSDLMFHCLQLDPSFHNTYTAGELIERVNGDVATLGNFFSRLAIHLLGNVVLLVGVLVLLFRIDWRLGAALLLFVAASLGVILWLHNIAVPAWTAARAASAWLFGFLEERLSGAEDIRTSSATAYALYRLDEHAQRVLGSQKRAGLLSTVTGSSTLILLTLGTAVALAISVYLLRTGAITLGTVFLVFTYAELLRRPIEQITRQMQDLQQANASLNRIQELLDIRSAIMDNGIQPLPAGALSVDFCAVSFGYAPEQPVLRQVSFQAQPGMRLGVLGRSGSGKTTLTRLLFRLYDPQAGAIRLGETDLRDIPLQELRRHIGLVTQDVQLFHASVRDNVTLFDPHVPDSRILQVLADLGLDAWLALLPEGLATKLAPGGSYLSAGEAQLLAFARVFLQNPGLVILDEASARLDPATEQRLEHAIDRLLSGRTAIIIAHRLATVLRADMILILEDGQVREYGPRNKLASDPRSRFTELLRIGLEDVLT